MEQTKEEIWLEEACQVIVEMDSEKKTICDYLANDWCKAECMGLTKNCVRRYLKKRTGMYCSTAELYAEFNPKFKEGDIIVDNVCEKEAFKIIAIVGDQYKMQPINDRPLYFPVYEFVECIDANYKLKGK